MNDTERMLRDYLKDGRHIVYTSLNHVSQSGMSRSISLYVSTGKGQIQDITGLVCRLQNKTRDRYSGIHIGGCGMNMGFALVYDLSHALYPNGHRCRGKACRSNDHSNGDRNRDGKHKHGDGGYALEQRWI